MRIMNRHIRHTILLALAIVVMAACGGGGSDVPSPAPTPTPTPTPTNPTDPEPTPIPTPQPAEPQPVAIGFRADLSDAVATTRSAPDPGDGVLTTELLQGKGFGVYCWYTGAADFTTPSASINMLMRNQKVEWKSTKWDYSPSKYWPLDSEEKLTFRAYAPYTDYLLEDETTGMPMLPVVVKKDDYNNGSQHDPLWGTGRRVQTTGANAGEYFPLPDPPTSDALKEYYRYGSHYDNITYKMSGSWRDKPTDHNPVDTRNGYIDWYFHHGMAMLVFNARLEDTSGDSEVYITNIKISPLYENGQLSISSDASITNDKPDKPTWKKCGGDMEVDINKFYDEESESYIGTFTIHNEKDAHGDPIFETVTNPGLLVIPRDFTGAKGPLTISVSYKRPNDNNVYTVKKEIDTQVFQGNTIYTLNLTVGSALVAVIESVNVAFTSWAKWVGEETEHEVYNW